MNLTSCSSNRLLIPTAKLLSCINEMENVVGDTIPEIDLKIAATKYNYNYELALNSVLSCEQIIMDDKASDSKAKNEKKPNNNGKQEKKKGGTSSSSGLLQQRIRALAREAPRIDL